MRCRRALKLVSLRLDGALSSKGATDLDLHLASCASCRRSADQLEQAWRVLAQPEPPPPAPDDWTAIEAAVEGQRRRWFPGSLDLNLVPTRAVAVAVLVAMAIVGGAGGLLLGRTLPPSRPAPVETQLIADTLGDLPWDSPAAGLEPVLHTGQAAVEERP